MIPFFTIVLEKVLFEPDGAAALRGVRRGCRHIMISAS